MARDEQTLYAVSSDAELALLREASVAEDGKAIDTATDLFFRKDAARVKQKYSMYYLYVLVRELCELCAELECKGRFYPFLREFFVVFGNPNRSWILRKKSWNPHAPFHF